MVRKGTCVLVQCFVQIGYSFFMYSRNPVPAGSLACWIYMFSTTGIFMRKFDCSMPNLATAVAPCPAMELLKSLTSRSPELKLLSLQKLKTTVKTRFPDAYKQIPAATYKEYISKQEIHQINQQIPKKKDIEYLRIVGAPYTFQIDIMVYGSLDQNQRALLCIDILSRKLFTYPLTVNASMQSVLEAYKIFVQDAREHMDPKVINKRVQQVTGDAFFDNKQFLEYNTSLFIMVKTTVAKDNHFAGYLSGNPLGIVDRVTRTIKSIILKIQTKDIHTPFVDALKQATDLYNSTVHRSLYGKTPNDFYKSLEMCRDLREAYIKHNNALSQKQDLPIGTRVRAVQQKHQFQKEKPPYTRTIYTVSGKEGFRYVLKDESGNEIKRRYNFNELFVLFVLNPGAVTCAPHVEKQPEVRVEVEVDDDDDLPPLEEIPLIPNIQNQNNQQPVCGDQISVTRASTHDQGLLRKHEEDEERGSHLDTAYNTAHTALVSSRLQVHDGILPKLAKGVGPKPFKRQQKKKKMGGQNKAIQKRVNSKQKGMKSNPNTSVHLSAPLWVTNVNYKPPARPSPEERKRRRATLENPETCG